MSGRMTTNACVVKLLVCLAVLSCAAISSGADEDANLSEKAGKVFTPLPEVMASDQNPVTREKIALGRMLFHETRISVDGTVSCAKCHPMGLYAADGLRKAAGNNCKPNPRNSPTVLNAAAQISAHWIGNRMSVEDQAKQAITGPPSFGMPSYEAAEKKLMEVGYTPFFKAAFPGDTNPVTIDNFARAVGAFERTLVTPSDFDAYLKGNEGALTEEQKKGLRIFMETGCTACHSGAYLGGQTYQKFGILSPYWDYTKSDKVDEGRFAVTKNEADKYLFKVPTLRNVVKTPPYFHDGSVDRIEDAVRIMAKVQLGRDLSPGQVDAIHVFLGSLTGEIPGDAMKIPYLPSGQ